MRGKVLLTAQFSDGFVGASARKIRKNAFWYGGVSMKSIIFAFDNNSQAWPRWGVWVWPNKYVAESYDDEVSYLKQWLHDRLAWMDETLGFSN